MRLDPSDIPVLAAIDHVELAGGVVLEQQRRRIAQVHQHHGIRYAGIGDVYPRLGNDRRKVGLTILCAVALRRGRKDGVGGILDERLRFALVDLMFLQPVGVATQLLFNPVGRAVEGDFGLPAAVGRRSRPARRCRR